VSVLYIEEYGLLGNVNGVAAQAPLQPSITTQTVSIGGSSTQSVAFNAQTSLVRLHTDVICSYLFGTASTATATTSTPRMAANQTEYFAIQKGANLLVAVISNT
jgi:hypothetical protein